MATRNVSWDCNLAARLAPLEAAGREATRCLGIRSVQPRKRSTGAAAWSRKSRANPRTMGFDKRFHGEACVETTDEMVYVVDDDPGVREALSSLLRANDRAVRTFTSGQEFLNFRREDVCACLILDLKMPGLGGLELQKLISAKTSIPIIFITGRGDVPSTVRAMKGGAIDFLTKPLDEAVLLAAVDKALQQDRANRQEAIQHALLVARYESLTPRERQVLPLLVKGLLNKQAGEALGITEYTVQVHRGHIMRKMQADSFATLVKFAAKLKVEPTGESTSWPT
jgi:FixJ family two-component response regulator